MAIPLWFILQIFISLFYKNIFSSPMFEILLPILIRCVYILGGLENRRQYRALDGTKNSDPE